MLTKLNKLLNITMGTVTGVFLGYAIFAYFDYRNRPDFYAMQSAPWYGGTMIYGTATAVVLLIGFVLKYLFKKHKEK